MHLTSILHIVISFTSESKSKKTNRSRTIHRKSSQSIIHLYSMIRASDSIVELWSTFNSTTSSSEDVHYIRVHTPIPDLFLEWKQSIHKTTLYSARRKIIRAPDLILVLNGSVSSSQKTQYANTTLRNRSPGKTLGCSKLFSRVYPTYHQITRSTMLSFTKNSRITSIKENSNFKKTSH